MGLRAPGCGAPAWLRTARRRPRASGRPRCLGRGRQRRRPRSSPQVPAPTPASRARFDLAAHALGHVRRAVAVRFAQQECQLLATDARRDVRRAAMGAQDLAQVAKHCVADCVREAVVDRREPVDVEQDDGERPTVRAGIRKTPSSAASNARRLASPVSASSRAWRVSLRFSRVRSRCARRSLAASSPHPRKKRARSNSPSRDCTIPSACAHSESVPGSSS